jgi:hypothetical protein
MEQAISRTSVTGTLAGVAVSAAAVASATALLPAASDAVAGALDGVADRVLVGAVWAMFIAAWLAGAGAAAAVARALRGSAIVAGAAGIVLAPIAFAGSVWLYLGWACSTGGGGPWGSCPFS